MILCICSNMSESKIVALLKQGKTIKDIQDEFMVARRCRSCESDFRKLCETHKGDCSARLHK